MLLENRIAVITGAAAERGLGLATARLFAEHGATCFLLDLDAEAAARAAADLDGSGSGSGHDGLRCDVTLKADCDAAAGHVLERHGRIDILVNIAGITQPIGIMDVDKASYDRVLDVNLRGTLQMSQAVIPAMRAAGSGAIVNMSSASAQRGGGIFGGPHYSAAKAGVLGLTKAMARELAPDNIRVNAICPSYIDTDITGGLLSDAMLEQIIASVPMGRVGQAMEVAGCALFLASDLSSYVTGSEVDVNGGSHIH